MYQLFSQIFLLHHGDNLLVKLDANTGNKNETLKVQYNIVYMLLFNLFNYYLVQSLG